MKKNNTYNQVGATYLAVNINGYSYDKSPFVALSGLWIETLGKTPRYRSKQWEELARKTSLWYIPNYEDCVGTSNYEPVDKDNLCCGVLLSSSCESNDQHIRATLKDSVIVYDPQQPWKTAPKKLCHTY